MVGLFLFRRARNSRPTQTEEGLYSKVVGLITAVALLICLPLGLAYIGFFEGVIRASAFEFSEGEFAREYFPDIGSAGADLVGTLLLAEDMFTREEAQDSRQDYEAIRRAFRSGDRQIEAAEIATGIVALDQAFVTAVAEVVKEDVVKRVPTLSSGKGKQALDWFMDNFSEALVRAGLRRSLEDDGLGSFIDVFGQVVQRLPEAAARDENRDFLSHQETSSFLVEVGIADGVMRFVVRPFCRTYQIGALLFVFLLLSLPFAFRKKSDLSGFLLSWINKGDRRSEEEKSSEAK